MMVRILGLVVLGLSLTVFAAGCAGGETEDDGGSAEMSMDEGGGGDAEEVAEVTCPVSGLPADPAKGPSVEHDGTTYHFCCEKCVAKFKKDPAAFTQ